jgi:thymidylate synthase
MLKSTVKEGTAKEDAIFANARKMARGATGRANEHAKDAANVKAALNPFDDAYLSLVREVLENGAEKKDRTGVGTISIFGTQRKYDLRQGFPILTTKRVSFEGILRELLWFLKGSTNINDDLKQHTPIWNAWADENGELGPVYGYQWRKWEKFVADGKGGYVKNHVDQIQQAIDTIKKNPDSRRIIVSAWNVADIDQMKLPPCHAFFQFYVVNGRLDLQLYQRSADIALGVPYNIASYAALLMMVAQECGLEAGIFTHTMGDTHIYSNHLEGLQLQLTRKAFAPPILKIAKKPFWELKFEDFTLENYQHGEFIKFKVAV